MKFLSLRGFVTSVCLAISFATGVASFSQAQEVQIPEPVTTFERIKVEAPKANAEVVIGQENAPVVIVEYLSQTCGACAMFHEESGAFLRENYVDKGHVKYVQRFLLRNRVDVAVSMLTMCAGDKSETILSDFLEKQQEWFSAQSPLNALMEISAENGLDEDAFKACLANSDILNALADTSDNASEEFGVESTPTFFINGRQYNGVLLPDTLKAIVDPLIEG